MTKLFEIVLVFITMVFMVSSGSAQASNFEEEHYKIGNYFINIDHLNDSLTVIDLRVPAGILFSSEISKLVRTGHSNLEIEEGRGNFKVKDEGLAYTCSVAFQKLNYSESQIQFQGLVLGEHPSCEGLVNLSFSENDLSHLAIHLDSQNPLLNYWELKYDSSEFEDFYGFGEQFSHLSLKGQKVPILVREQGVGRGHPLITPFVNASSDGWGGGGPLNTYIAIPQYISSENRGVYLENSSYSEFDLSDNKQVKIRVFDSNLRGGLFSGQNSLELLESYTAWSGRMSNLPDWVHEGAIVGLQGGTDKVRKIVNQLLAEGTPISAVWLQDWVGQRTTSVGQQLWWNWELDEGHYPKWKALVQELRGRGIRVLGYINPFLVNVAGDPLDDPNYSTVKDNYKRNLYLEALEKGYLIRNKEGAPYRNLQTSFGATLVDLSNDEARTWLKNIIKTNLIGSGLSGWMADFAEALPFDAQLFNGDANTYHNQYAQEWAKLNREAIVEAGLEDEILTFHRSGFSKSPKYAGMFWQGDQMVTWDEYDGFKTAIVSLLGGGYSGLSLNHSDIGGYAGFKIWKIGFSREQNLLERWMEANAFTAMFRSHEGNQPANNSQVYSSPVLMKSFARNASVFKALGTYRKSLVAEAASKGWPVVRHPMMHYPEDQTLKNNVKQFMLGDSFMVCPVLEKQKSKWPCYLPEGEWVHLWTDQVLSSQGEYFKVGSPVGQTPVFYPASSKDGGDLKLKLKAEGLIH